MPQVQHHIHLTGSMKAITNLANPHGLHSTITTATTIAEFSQDGTETKRQYSRDTRPRNS
jgi:hypothetical protein